MKAGGAVRSEATVVMSGAPVAVSTAVVMADAPTWEASLAQLGPVLLQVGSKVEVSSGAELATYLRDLHGVIAQTLRAFVAERLALSSTAQHALGNIEDDDLIRSIRETKSLRGKVAPVDVPRFASLMMRAAPDLVDGELLAAILGIEIEEGDRLFLGAAGAAE